MARQARNHAGLDQRRLAAARRAIEQADRKRARRVFLIDPALPRSDRDGQAVSFARARDERGKEFGILDVESAQPLGDHARARVCRRGLR